MRISKLIIAGTVLALLSSATVFGQTAQTTDSAELTLSGQVAGRVAISVLGTGDFSNLDLMQDVTNQKVATVTEQSNVSTGYTVTLTSSNFEEGGPRFAGGAGDDTLAYSLRYNGADVDFSTNDAVITDENDRLEAVNGVDKDLEVSYQGTAVNIVEGTYSDTLTFEIAAK